MPEKLLPNLAHYRRALAIYEDHRNRCKPGGKLYVFESSLNGSDAALQQLTRAEQLVQKAQERLRVAQIKLNNKS